MPSSIWTGSRRLPGSHQRARPSGAQFVRAAQVARAVRQRARVDRRFPAAVRAAIRRLAARATDTLARSRLGWRPEEPALAASRRSAITTRCIAASTALPGARRPAFRLQPLAADRRHAVASAYRDDARRLAMDHPRRRRCGCRGGARDRDAGRDWVSRAANRARARRGDHSGPARPC